MTSEDSKTIQEDLKKCSCGHDKNHHSVHGVGKYTGVGLIFHLIGVSYKPIEVRYQCLECSEYFDNTTDPEVLKKFY